MPHPQQQPGHGPWPQQRPSAAPWSPPPSKRSGAAGVVIGVCAGVFALLAIAGFVILASGPDTTSTAATPASSSSPSAAGPAPSLDDAAQAACDTFAHGYHKGMAQADRMQLAHDVNVDARASHTGDIADNGHILANGATGSAGAWQLAADTFANACLEHGWTA